MLAEEVYFLAKSGNRLFVEDQEETLDNEIAYIRFPKMRDDDARPELCIWYEDAGCPQFQVQTQRTTTRTSREQTRQRENSNSR